LIISQHFETRYSLAIGIAVCGASVGTLVLSPGTDWLFRRFGLAWSFRILGATYLILIPCGLIFRPAVDGASVPLERFKYFDWTIFKNRAFLVYLISLKILMLGYLVPYVHLMRLAEDMGAKPIQAALLISYLAIGSTVGRLVFGRLADCQQLSQFYLWQTGLLGISVSSTFVAIVTTYHWLVLYAVTFGLCEGCYITLNPVLIRKLVGTDKFANGLGISYFAMSFTRSAGPPIAGWIFDYFKSYYVAFLYTGFVFMLGNCVAFIAQVVESNSKRTERDAQGRRKSTSSLCQVVEKETVL